MQTFLDGSDQGVIYFSLGSNIKSKDLSPQLQNTIIETFSELPYRILWKFEEEDLPNKPENVKIVKWLPQQDILSMEIVVLFLLYHFIVYSIR